MPEIRNQLRDPQPGDTFESSDQLIQIYVRNVVHRHQVDRHGFKTGTDYVEYRECGRYSGRGYLAASSMVKKLKNGFVVVDREVWNSRMEKQAAEDEAF